MYVFRSTVEDFTCWPNGRDIRLCTGTGAYFTIQDILYERMESAIRQVNILASYWLVHFRNSSSYWIILKHLGQSDIVWERFKTCHPFWGVHFMKTQTVDNFTIEWYFSFIGPGIILFREAKPLFFSIDWAFSHISAKLLTKIKGNLEGTTNEISTEIRGAGYLYALQMVSYRSINFSSVLQP